jgi:hypothetical protein
MPRGLQVLSDQRFYFRRAAEERARAARALTPQAREWHQSLATDFAQRAQVRELQPSL